MAKMKLSATFRKLCTADSEPPKLCDFLKVALILQYKANSETLSMPLIIPRVTKMTDLTGVSS